MSGIAFLGPALVVFALLFVVFPAAFLAWYLHSSLGRDRIAAATAEQRPAVAAKTRLAWVLTACALGALGLLLLLEEPPRGAWLGISFGGFHVVWWTAVAPLLRVGRAEAAPALPGDLARPAPQTSVRTASLTARRETQYLPAWAWSLPAAVLIAAVAALVWHAVVGHAASAPALPAGTWLLVAGSFVAALSFLIGYGWWARRAANAPQDLSGAADPHLLAREIDAFRRFLVRSIFALMVLAMIVFLGAGVAVALTHGDPALQGRIGGWWGGIGGSVVGLLGGVFGTVCSVRRMRLERLRRGGAPAAAVAPRQGV